MLVMGVAVAVGMHAWNSRSSSEQNSSIARNGAGTTIDTDTMAGSALSALAGDEFARLTIPYLRTLPFESELGEQKLFQELPTYTSYTTSYPSENLRINGLLTIPKGEAPEGGWPAIVFVHGYIPPSVYQTTQRYTEYVDYLARNGFVVFKIDLRGHGNSEGEASGAYYSGDYVVDVLSARAALARASFVNPQAIGLWGHSMAGNVVMRSLAVQPEIPAAVIWAGAVYSYQDWQKYGLNDNSYRPPEQEGQAEERQRRRQKLFDTHGQFAAETPFWQLVAPTNYLSDIHSAIQLHHAVDDSVVDIGYSRDLAGQLDQTSIEHELFEYTSGGHNISGSSFSTAMQRTVEFFQKHLGQPHSQP